MGLSFNGFNTDLLVKELVDGDSADTNIAVANITTEDELISVLGIDPDNGTAADQVKDFTSTSSITSDGNIQNTVDTSGYDLWVTWADKSGADDDQSVKQIA